MVNNLIFFFIYFYLDVWVFLDDPELSENLQYIAITTLSNEECKLTYGNQIVDTMVCVDGNYNEGSCNVNKR